MRAALLLFLLAASSSFAQDTLRYRIRYSCTLLEKDSTNAHAVEFIRDTGSGIHIVAHRKERTLTQAMLDTTRYVPATSITRITFQRRGGKGRGALIGAGIGVGIAIPVIVGQVAQTDALTATTLGPLIVGESLLLGALGAGFGALFGGPKHRFLVDGSEERYGYIRPELQYYRPHKRQPH